MRERDTAKELDAPPRHLSIDDAVRLTLSKLGYSDGDGADEKKREERR